MGRSSEAIQISTLITLPYVVKYVGDFETTGFCTFDPYLEEKVQFSTKKKSFLY